MKRSFLIGFLSYALTASWPACASHEAPKFSAVWMQGAPLIGRTERGATVIFDGRKIRVSSAGKFFLGLAFDAPPAAELEVHFADGTRERFKYSVASRDYEVQHIGGLPSAMVTPPAAVLARISSDQNLVEDARKFDTAREDAFAKWRWPVAARVTGVYGAKRILNGEERQPHFGIDLAAPQGAPIRAPASGVVRMAHKDLYYTGGTIILDHGFGVSSTYLHMSRLDVRVGDEVSAGQTIGLVGKTGRATGPHLCWRVNWFDVRLDPSLMLRALPAEKGELKK